MSVKYIIISHLERSKPSIEVEILCELYKLSEENHSKNRNLALEHKKRVIMIIITTLRETFWFISILLRL